MGEPGFWDDQERAAKVSAEHARASRKLAAYRETERELDDLEALEELAAEDESIADEVAEQRREIEAKLAGLEEERLFAGPYDAGDAAVSVHAGTGGADSQGWGEKLPCLLLRLGEGGGLPGGLLGGAPGGGGGVQ